MLCFRYNKTKQKSTLKTEQGKWFWGKQLPPARKKYLNGKKEVARFIDFLRTMARSVTHPIYQQEY